MSQKMNPLVGYSAGQRFALRTEGERSDCNYMMKAQDAKKSHIAAVFALGVINESRVFKCVSNFWPKRSAIRTRAA